MNETVTASAQAEAPEAIGPEQLREFTAVLERYNSGLSRTKRRIVAAENWWKMRNGLEEQRETELGKPGEFSSASAWLHNVIASKHADAMEAYPQPNILPREEQDRQEAAILSAIIPCVLEQNRFERVYSDAMWAKCKTGTGVYKVVWDPSKLNGLGDICVESCNLLNLYWEPGVSDIQKSRYFFHTELVYKDVLEAMYPELEGKIRGNDFVSTKFLYDDVVDTSDRVTVIDVYYHKGGALHYCKYVGDQVIYATENRRAETYTDERGLAAKSLRDESRAGLYDHGKYPYVFDALFPIEGSPCGYGYVDVCKNPQTEIDLLNTAFIKNAMANATPRYFASQASNVNEKEFLDLSKPIVHTGGGILSDSVMQIVTSPMDEVNVYVLDRVINELRETSGNTETSTGNISSGVTAASAIAALQEASGKGSRDATMSSYRAYSEITGLVIELIRQFYDMPRQFRIVGTAGTEQFVSYSNEHLRQQPFGQAFGQDMGYRLPVFDIKISAEKKSVYTRVSQNELALQFFQLGFFNPQMSTQALAALDMMEFEGKQTTMQQISRNGTLYQKLVQYAQMALLLCRQYRPDMAEGLAQDIIQITGQPLSALDASGELEQTDNIAGVGKDEAAIVTNARERSADAAVPDGGKVTGKAKDT